MSLRLITFVGAGVFLAASLAAWSDGVGFTPDRKHLSAPHVTVKLTQKQQAEVEHLRTLTLTDDQSREFARNSGKVVKKLDVLTSRYTGCTCGMGPYAVWCNPGEVEVPEDSMQRAEDDKTSEFSLSVQNGAADSPKQDVAIILDSKGRMFRNGRSVTEDTVRDAIKRLSQTGPEPPYVFLDPPPPTDTKAEIHIQALVGRLAAFCREHKVTLAAPGFEPRETD